MLQQYEQFFAPKGVQIVHVTIISPCLTNWKNSVPWTFALPSRSCILLQSSTHRSLEKQAEHGEAACQPWCRHWEEGQGEGAVSRLFLSCHWICPALVCMFFSCQIHESSPLDLASEESERLPCLLTLLDMGAHVNAGDKHSRLFITLIILKALFYWSFIHFEISSLKEKRLCSMPWPAVTGLLCTTRRTSICCCREVLTVSSLQTEVQIVQLSGHFWTNILLLISQGRPVATTVVPHQQYTIMGLI